MTVNPMACSPTDRLCLAGFADTRATDTTCVLNACLKSLDTVGKGMAAEEEEDGATG